MAQAAGYAVLPISASLLGVTDELRTQLLGPTQKAAKQAGDSIRKEMAGGADQAAKQVEKANWRVKKSQDELTAAESKLAEQKLKTQAANNAVESAARKRAEAESKGIDAVEKAENDLLKKRAQAEKAARDLATAESGVERALSESARATKSLADRQADLDRETTGAEKSSRGLRDRLREMGDEAQGAGGMFDGLASKVGAFAGVAGAGMFLGMGKALSGEIDLVNLQLGHVGAEAEATGAAIKETLQSGVAGSAEEAANAVASLESTFKNLGRDGEQTSAELADNFLGFSKVFEVDLAEATKNAGILITNGLAPDVESAADLMTAAMQGVPAGVRDEIMDATNEYSVFFANMGFSGEEAMGLLVDAAEGGQYAVDKTGDAIKEFSVLAIDPAKAKAFEALGINAQDAAASVAQGGEGAKSTLEEVAQKLLDMEDPGARAATAVELFGAPIEDLGVDQIPAFLESLTGMSGGLGEVEGASQRLADELSNTLDGRINRLKGGVQSLAEDAFMAVWDVVENDLIPAFQDFGGWVQDNEKWLAPLSVVVGGMAGGMLAWAGATKVYTAAQGLATGAFKLFDSVTKKSMLGMIVMAVTGIVTALIWFFRETELGQEIWGNFTGFLKSSWESVADVFGAVVDAITGWWSGLTDSLSTGWEALKTGVFDAFTWYVDQWKLVFEVATQAVSTAWEWVTGGLSAGWEWIKTAVFDAFTWYVDQWKLVFEVATQAVSTAWTLLKDSLAAVWETIKTAVFDAWTWYVDRVKANWDLVTTALGNAWTWVKDTLGAGWEWIKSNVFDVFISTTDSVRDRFSGFVDAIGQKWDGLKSLLAKPINFMINTVYNDGILRAWNIIAGILPGLDKGNPLAGIPEHATGGRISGPGTGTSDDVLMWGSNGEHMLTAREVQEMGGHGAVYAMRDAVQSGRPFTFDGQGGLAILPKTDERAGDLAGAAPHLLIPGFAEGGAIRPMWEIQLENGHRAAKMRHGNPYTWAHEDCSGYMSMIADAITRGGDGIRRWATSSFPGGQPWVPGLGAGFSVGVHDNPGGPGGGHTAGTLTGVGPYMTTNVESGGSPSMVKYGIGAAGADSPQFRGVHPGQFHLAIGAGGAFESGGAGGGVDPGVMRGWISEKLGGVIDTIMDPLVSLLPSPPPQWQGIPRGVYDTGRDGLVESIADGVAGLTDGLATVWNAVRDIPDLVREGLAGGDDVNRAAGQGYHLGGLAPAGRGFMAKTAMEPEMVLDPEMTKAFIQWMGVAREIGDTIAPVAVESATAYATDGATSVLDVMGLGGLVGAGASLVSKFTSGANAPSASSTLGASQVADTPGDAAAARSTVVIEASSMEDVVRVGDLKEVSDRVDGLEVKIDEKKAAPAATVTRGGVM